MKSLVLQLALLGLSHAAAPPSPANPFEILPNIVPALTGTKTGPNGERVLPPPLPINPVKAATAATAAAPNAVLQGVQRFLGNMNAQAREAGMPMPPPLGSGPFMAAANAVTNNVGNANMFPATPLRTMAQNVITGINNIGTAVNPQTPTPTNPERAKAADAERAKASGDDEDVEMLMAPQSGKKGPTPAYETNERGQFLTLDSYAQAMSDQLGLPLPVARRMAELNKSFGRQLIMLNNAVADWIGTVEEKMPPPGSFGEPIITGLEAATGAAQNPAVQAALPVVTGMVDMMLTGLSSAFRMPTDAFLETPRTEIQNLNELVHAISPVYLDSVQPPTKTQTPTRKTDDEAKERAAVRAMQPVEQDATASEAETEAEIEAQEANAD